MNLEEVRLGLQSPDLKSRIDAVENFEKVPENNLKVLFETVLKDFHREVRQAAARQIHLFPSKFEDFINDPDPEVKIIAISNSLKVVQQNDFKGIVKKLALLINDPISSVKCAVAKVLPELVEKDTTKTILADVISIAKEFLNSNDDDLKIESAKIVQRLTKTYGFDYLFEKLSEPLNYILVDSQWRVRKIGWELIIALSLQVDEQFFSENLLKYLTHFLKDECYQMRKFTISYLPALVDHFKEKWLTDSFTPILQNEFQKSPNFLDRETYLFSVSTLASQFPVEFQSNCVFQPMIRMLKEGETNKCYNVVLLAMDLLKKDYKSIHPFRLKYELKPILDNLAKISEKTIANRASSFLELIQEPSE